MWKYCLKTSLFFLVSLCMLLSAFQLHSTLTAAPLLNRSVQIGNSLPSATTTNQFTFTLGTVGTLGSIEFEYCENSPLVGTPCTAPTGLNLTAVTLTNQTGETGFSIDASSTINKILITRSPGANAAIPVSYTFTNVVNPSTSNYPTFVRISTFASADGSGPRIDSDAVAFSTSTDFNVAGYVPPYLIFCVGVTVAADCSSASGQLLNLGELQKTQTSYATSQFAGATNDPGGYSTTVSGLTMTSGTNTIPALGSPTSSQTGVSQFGINLRANTNPSVGANPSGIGTAVPTSNYNQPNLYTFQNQVVAVSPLSTNFNVFTVSYVVNVSSNQSAGIYNTTLTYIAVAAF